MSKIKSYVVEQEELGKDFPSDPEILPPDYQAFLDGEQEVSEEDKDAIEECF